MSPKEFNFMCDVIEQVAVKSYRMGSEDQKAAKPLNFKQFKVSKANRMTLQSELKKHTK